MFTQKRIGAVQPGDLITVRDGVKPPPGRQVVAVEEGVNDVGVHFLNGTMRTLGAKNSMVEVFNPDSIKVDTSTWQRLPEVRRYAVQHGISLDYAIQQLVNSGLSHL